jgi:imidazolonepropionase-like amidohydrolase
MMDRPMTIGRLSTLGIVLGLIATASFAQDRSWFRDNRAAVPPGTETTDDPRRVPLPAAISASATKFAIIGGRVFDGTGRPARPATIVIEGNRIVRVAPPGERQFPAGTQIIDASDKTVLPGLIDMHSHISYATPGVASPFGANGADTEADATLRAQERLRFYIESGITSVRDVGSEGMVPFRLKQWVAEHRLPLPRIFAAGLIITAKGGHGAERITDDMASVREASGPDDFRQAVREQFEKGADFIKLASHFSQAEVEAAVDEAHALGMKVTVDAENEYITRAVEAGVDMVEHPLPRPDSTIALMAKRGVGAIPTLIPYIYINDLVGGYFGSTSRRFEVTPSTHFAMLQKLQKAGVKIGVGTDLVSDWYRYLPHPYIAELTQFVAAGLSPSEALIAATRTNAELLQMDDKLGTLEPGKLADLVIVAGKPDLVLADLANIETVFRDGAPVVQDGMVSIPRHTPAQPPQSR